MTVMSSRAPQTQSPGAGLDDAAKAAAEETEAGAFGARRFLLAGAAALALLAFLLCLVVTATDPHRYLFGSPVPQIWPSTRRSKIDLFREYSARRKVTGVIFGSSRSTLLPPEQADRLTGLRFFNAAVVNVSTDDYVAFYRLFRNIQHAPPRMLIVGLELPMLGSQIRLAEELSSNYPLISQLEPNLPVPLHYAGIYARYFRIETFIDLKTSLTNWRHPKPPAYVFLPDGRLPAPDFPDRSTLMYELSQGMEKFLREYRDFNSISEERVDRLRTLLREAEANGTQVMIWLTPVHPALGAAIDHLPDVVKAEKQAFKIVSVLCGQYHARLLDLSDPASFGGDPSTWVDAVHTSGADAKREVDRLLRPGS